MSATAAGSVTIASFGYNNGAGNYIAVDHGGGYISRYLHLQDTFAPGITVGVTASQGQTLANADNSGFSTGTHLHFDLKLNGNAYVPEPMSNVTGFGQYGACTGVYSPYWVSYPMGEAIGVSSWSSNRVDVFVRGNNGAMYRKWWDGTGWYPTSTWEAHPGCLTDGPTAVSWGANRIDVFVRGCDNLLYWKYWNGGPNWSGWQQFADGCLGSAPAVVSWGFGRLDLFVRGCGGELVWRNTADGGASWTGWQNLGGCLSAGPGAATWGGNHLAVFVRACDNQMYRNFFFGGPWSGFVSLGGCLGAGPGADSWGVNRLDVLVPGCSANDQMFHNSSANGGATFFGFVGLGGCVTSGAGVTSRLFNNLDVFARGCDTTLYHKAWTGAAWTGWAYLAPWP